MFAKIFKLKFEIKQFLLKKKTNLFDISLFSYKLFPKFDFWNKISIINADFFPVFCTLYRHPYPPTLFVFLTLLSPLCPIVLPLTAYLHDIFVECVFWVCCVSVVFGSCSFLLRLRRLSRYSDYLDMGIVLAEWTDGLMDWWRRSHVCGGCAFVILSAVSLIDSGKW